MKDGILGGEVLASKQRGMLAEGNMVARYTSLVLRSPISLSRVDFCCDQLASDAASLARAVSDADLDSRAWA